MANEHVRKGMRMMYGNLLENHPNFVPILLRCFACIIYLSEKLIDMKNRIPGNKFNHLQILNKDNLLQHLRLLVTTDPTVGMMDTSTGILPHVNQVKILREIFDSITSLCSVVMSQSITIIEAVCCFLDEQDMSAGQITPDQSSKLLNDFQQKWIRDFRNKRYC